MAEATSLHRARSLTLQRNPTSSPRIMETTTASPLTTSPSGKLLPKSYLSAKEREKVLRELDFDALCSEESSAAEQVGDDDAAWAWLAAMETPAPNSLMFLKIQRGAQFIRDLGFNTAPAEAVFGIDWLEKEYQL